MPNVTFESYIESRKLSVPRARPARTASRPARLEAALASPQRARTKGVRRQPAPPLESYRSPGRDQQEQLRVQRAWRPHLLRRSEHEPKECAGSLLRCGRVPNVAFEWPLFAVGKRARPGKALKHLQGTVFSAEALSRARPAFLLPFCCRRTPLVGSRCGQRSASSLPFCCRRTPLVSFLFLSAAGASAGSEAFVAGRSLWTFSAESYAQQVFEHSRPAQLRGSWCSGITPAQHARGARFNPRPVHAHVRCVCHSLPLPGLSSLWVCCASCQDRLVRRGRVPNATFESYIESYRSPGRDQQEQLRVQRAWRPHSLRRSEHEPKECAGSLLRRGRVPNVAAESNMQQGYGSRGSGQPEKLRFPRFSRPHSCVHSERQPKECAGSRKEKERKETKKNKKKGKERRLVRYRAERARAKGKGEGCHSHAPTLNEHSPSAFPLQAGGRRICCPFLLKPASVGLAKAGNGTCSGVN